MLANLGGVEGKVVIDLFAGTGALGIEALSRGARSATFVEQDPRTVAVLRRNLEVIADRRATVEVATADVLGWLGRQAGHPSRTSYDVAFADPPYRFDLWNRLMAALMDARVLLAVLESEVPVAVPDAWEIVREKRYGGTVVTLIQPLPAVTSKGPM